ncbi:MAG: FAD-dependent oxidoreductase [Alphaproteobacteria bacterium]|nr:FAD-dependent oxidoreductase [Alphaproteobacteria bacterium]
MKHGVLTGTVLALALLAGGSASRPHVARRGLGPALIEPALARLEALGARLRFGARLRRLDADFLEFGDERRRLEPGDRVVLAVPPAQAATLLPGLPELPGSPIVNAHFRLDQPPAMADGPMLGLVGGVAQWLFLRDDVLTVTVSAARDLVAMAPGQIAARLWRDCAAALSLGGPIPPVRVVKERRATLLHTPPVERLRPSAATGLPTVFLAGDWTATGLPCTIEGAIRSGRTAAHMACR